MDSKCNWEKNLQLNIKILKFLGLWPGTPYKFGFYTTYAVILTLIHYSLFVLEGLKLYYMQADVVTMIDVSFYPTVQLLYCVKVAAFALNYWKVRRILEVLESDLFQPVTGSQLRRTRAKMELWHHGSRVFVGTVTSLGVLWMMVPVLTGSYRNLALPMPVICPWCNVPGAYVAVYLYVSVFILTLALSAFNIDLFVFALFVSIEVQFDNLCDSLRGLRRQFGGNLLRCIKHHQLLIKYTTEVNQLCNFITFAQFFLSTLLVSLLIVQANLIATDSFMMYSRTSGAVVFTLQIFVYCWFGENIETKSGKLTYSIFESSWIKEPAIVKKILLVLALNSAPVRISAFNIFYMSLGSYVKLMKSAYSFLMLLRQFANDL